MTASRTDVKFLKGNPIAKHSDADQWVFDAHSGSSEPECAAYIFRFNGESIRHITYWANERQIINPYLHGFSIDSNYDDVIIKLGTPSHTSTSKDGLSRLLSFETI